MSPSNVTASDWIKGIALSILASIIGGASKLAIRKSWLMEEDLASAYADGLMVVSPSSSSLTDEDAAEISPASGGTRPTSASPPSSAARRERTRKLVARLLRLSGMVGMSFLNPLCGVLAMNYASPSILAPFSGLTLVWIVLFSQPLIGEQPSTAQIVAATLIVLGEVIVAVFGDHTNDEGVTLDDIVRSYKEPALQLFFVGQTVWMIIVINWMRNPASSTLLKRFAWGVAGGSIAGCLNFIKDMWTILKATPEGQPLPSYFWLFAIMAIGCPLVGLLFLTACMKRYDATYSAAMYVGSFVVIASIMSAAHYHTFQNLGSIVNYILYPTGLLVLMTGVYMLVHATKETSSLTVQDQASSHPRESNPMEQRLFVPQEEPSLCEEEEPII